MHESVVDKLLKIDELFSKRHPNITYEGAIPADADELDYVTIPMKGVVVA